MKALDRSRVSGLAALLACALMLVGAGSAAAEPTAVQQQPTGQSPDEVLGYWTPERMRKAEPLEQPVAPPEAAATQSPRLYSQAPDLETDPALDTLYPQRIHGKLFFTIAGQNAQCSATVVTARSRDLILTAGHCVSIPGEVSGVGIVWATNVLFVPGYRNGVAPLGSYPATRLGAPVAWLQSGDIAFDVGTANLAPGPSGLIQDALGARGVAFNRSAKSYSNDVFAIYGYPAKPEPFYDGERLIICNSVFQGFEDFTGSPTAAPCHQQEGSSGGGWVRNGQVQSVVSHGGCPVASTACELMSGTYFGETAFQLYKNSSGNISKGKRKRLKRCKRHKGSKKRLRCRGRVQRFNEDPR